MIGSKLLQIIFIVDLFARGVYLFGSPILWDVTKTSYLYEGSDCISSSYPRKYVLKPWELNRLEIDNMYMIGSRSLQYTTYIFH